MTNEKAAQIWISWRYYDTLKRMAEASHRTLKGQCEHVLDRGLATLPEITGDAQANESESKPEQAATATTTNKE